jgi:hypothetical protein
VSGPPRNRAFERTVLARLAAGERQVDVARDLGVSRQRIHQIFTRALRPRTWERYAAHKAAWQSKDRPSKARTAEGSGSV